MTVDQWKEESGRKGKFLRWDEREREKKDESERERWSERKERKV